MNNLQKLETEKEAVWQAILFVCSEGQYDRIQAMVADTMAVAEEDEI